MDRNHPVFRIAGTALLTAALALPAALAYAADTSSSQSSAKTSEDQGKLSAHDRDFLMKAAQGGMLEVEAARLAMDRAASNDVKTFAQTLMQDHTAANEKLQRIAAEKGVDLPKQLDAKHKADIDRLSKLNGEAFDRAFLQHMGLRDHKKDISEFEAEAKHGKDAVVKGFAEETLPTLRKHLSMAEKIHGNAPTAETDVKSGAGKQ